MGATQANSGQGPYAVLIREYTQRQGQLRGRTISDGEMQAASNAVATAVFEDIIDEPSGFDLVRLAQEDATAIGRSIFSRFGSDTALRFNSAWAGAFKNYKN